MLIDEYIETEEEEFFHWLMKKLDPPKERPWFFKYKLSLICESLYDNIYTHAMQNDQKDLKMNFSFHLETPVLSLYDYTSWLQSNLWLLHILIKCIC